MNKFILVLLLSSFVLCLYSQKKNIILIEKYDLSTVQNAKEVTYYGLDFSLLKFVSPTNAFNDNEIKEKYLGAWLAFYQKEIPPDKYLRKWLDFKEGFNFNPISVQSRIDSIANDWVIVTPTTVTKEQIIRAIQSYKLTENEGLGFVIHPVLFDEITKNVYCYFTFFDVKTKNVYWISETMAEGFGRGIKEIYALGMVYSTKLYIDKVYKAESK